MLTPLSTELPQSHQEQFRVNEDLARDATPVQAKKRQLDKTSESDPLHAKRTRLACSSAQDLGVEELETKQSDKVYQCPLADSTTNGG